LCAARQGADLIASPRRRPYLTRTPTPQVAHRVQALLCGQSAQTPDSQLSLDQLETELVRSAMAATGGNQSAAARLLGLSRAQLIYRLKGLG
jgi:DNA-binding protein Fis